MTFLADRYARVHPALNVLPSGFATLDSVPAYLFRGECGCHPATLPTVLRESTYPAGGFGPADRAALQRLTGYLLQRFIDEDYGLDLLQATALLQHYGLPTEMLDFTAHSGYAAAFAVAGHSEVGRICVMPFAASGCRVVDVSEHPWAERPQRQLGYGVLMPVNINDLKSNNARDRLRVRWYQFPISSQDRVRFLPVHAGLVNPSDDPSAGFLRHHVTEHVERFGKFSPVFTEWLIGRIPMVPRCYLIMRFEPPEVVVRHRPASLLQDFDELTEAETSKRYWSAQYPDSSSERIVGWRWPAPGSLVADPRTYHPEI